MPTAAACLAAALVLSGCTGAPAATRPEPTPAPEPSISQQDQDAAAFEDVFRRYVELPLNTDTPEDVAALLSGKALEDDTNALSAARAAGQSTVGKDTSSGFVVTDRGTDAQGVDYMVGQACMDVSGTRTVDAGGNDVTPVREERLPLQMKAVRIDDGSWRISDFVRNDSIHACGRGS